MQPTAPQTTVFTPMDMSVAEALLKEVKQILDRLGRVFFLRHGTCLGAVRDHAFIEWDDDLDIGSVIGLHGLTEERIRSAAPVFEENGFAVSIREGELSIAVKLEKSGSQVDWTCYRIIDDSIYQWPLTQIPVSLHTDLKEIDFLGEKFNVPNPPEEYLRLKYGPEWMIPKRSGYEQDIMDLMPDEPSSASVRFLRFFRRFLSRRGPGSLQVLDFEGRPVKGAEVIVSSTTVLSGLVRSATDRNGMTGLDLPNAGYYVLTIRHGDHEEVLFMEKLEPSTGYVYRPDPETPSGRVNVLTTSRSASDTDS